MNLIVIGQGYVGLPLAVKAAEAGITVVGFDIDKQKIEKLRTGFTDSPDVSKIQILKLQEDRRITFTWELPEVTENAIYVIAVPTPLGINHEPDLSMLNNACEIISEHVKEDSLIINESTSFIGTLRDLIKPIIDKKSGMKNLQYAVAPERIDPGNKIWDMGKTPRIISGLTTTALERAVDFYSRFCEEIYTTSKPEVAEAAKLFENTFRQINIALVNEFSEIANKLNFTAHEVIAAASSKPYGFMSFYPGIGVGGHCIPVDPSYLNYSAEKVGVESKFINLANHTNLRMPASVVDRIKLELNNDLKNKFVQIAGIAYKSNVSDLRESPALLLIKELEKAGAEVIWHDPVVGKYNGQVSQDLDPQVDIGLIVTPHDQLDFSNWLDGGTKVLDLSSSSINYGWPKFL